MPRTEGAPPRTHAAGSPRRTRERCVGPAPASWVLYTVNKEEDRDSDKPQDEELLICAVQLLIHLLHLHAVQLLIYMS